MQAIQDIVIAKREKADTFLELPGFKEHRAKVVSVGPGRWKTDADGKDWHFPTSLKPNDRIAFSWRSGMEVRIGGEDYLVMREADVLCVIPDGLKAGVGDNWTDTDAKHVIATVTA